MPLGNKPYFTRGQSKDEVLNEAYLQSLEARIRRLEDMVAVSPLGVIKNASGFSIHLDGRIQNYEIVKLTENLPRNHANTSGFSDSDIDVNVLSYNHESGVFEDSNIQFETIEIAGVTSLNDTVGILLEFPREQATPRRVFVPWPLAQGDNLPGYDFRKDQALVHMASGYLQWMDIGLCSESGVSESG